MNLASCFTMDLSICLGQSMIMIRANKYATATIEKICSSWFNMQFHISPVEISQYIFQEIKPDSSIHIESCSVFIILYEHFIILKQRSLKFTYLFYITAGEVLNLSDSNQFNTFQLVFIRNVNISIEEEVLNHTIR